MWNKIRNRWDKNHFVSQAITRMLEGKTPFPVRRTFANLWRRTFPRQIWRLPDNFEDQLHVYRNRGKRVPRCIVYTAITGGYDQLMVPEVIDPSVDYVCFSDRPLNGYGLWQIRPIPFHHPDPTRVARFVKTHPFLLLGPAEFYVWTDANIRIVGSLEKHLNEFASGEAPIGFIHHPIRDKVTEEAEACIRLQKDDAAVIRNQMFAYSGQDLDKIPLFETNFFIAMRNDRLRPFFARWWSEIENHSRRDQISVGHALEITGVPFRFILPKGYSCRNHADFQYFTHEELKYSRLPSLLEQIGGMEDPWDYVPPLPAVPSGRKVDVIVCVFNALEHVKICLESLRKDMRGISKIIIVDDMSGGETSDFIRRFANGEPSCQLIENESNMGYTKSANRGLAASDADFRVLLNSDTEVAPGWVDKMLTVAYADDAIGIVGCMSNAASWQSLPSISGTKGQTAINELPEGASVQDMNVACERWSDRYGLAVVPLVHGFCFGIRASVIERIGLFDEENFSQFYGEENDYCFRAREAGFLLALATSSFVYHAKSKSISEEQRLIWMDRAGKALREKHGDAAVKLACDQMAFHPALQRMRESATADWSGALLGSDWTVEGSESNR